MRQVVRWGMYPALLIVAVSAAVGLVRAGLGSGAAAVVVVFLSGWPILVLEGQMPWRQAWRRKLAASGTDLVHMGFTAATSEAFRALTLGLALESAATLTLLVGGSLWPSTWPLVLQIGFALLVGDLGAYWLHRAAHASGTLWRIHAMHHSSERLSALSSGRNHPMNVVLVYAVQVVPLVLLGAPGEVLTAVGVFTVVNGMLQHANVDLRHGWLNQVFATADLHRLHHSAVLAEANSNFGSNLVVWDRVFGTWYLPGLDGPAQVGLHAMRMPDNVWVHLASPFTLERWRASRSKVS